MKLACSHPPCECWHDSEQMIQKDDQYYCSDKCSRERVVNPHCTCGHPDCRG